MPRGAFLVLAVAFCMAFALCGCVGQESSSTSAASTSTFASSTASSASPASASPSASGARIATPAYYVFESFTDFSGTVTDPNQLVLDGDGGHFEDWYYLSLALLDGERGRLCTFGRIVNFTYDVEGDIITLYAPTNEGIDFGYDGAQLEMGEGTLTLVEGGNVTVLRQVEDPPVPFK